MVGLLVDEIDWRFEMDQQLCFIASQIKDLVEGGLSISDAIKSWRLKNNHYLDGNEEFAIAEFVADRAA